MSLLEIILLIRTIPLASLYFSTIFPMGRFTLLILLYCALLLYIMLDVVSLFTSIETLGGLF